MDRTQRLTPCKAAETEHQKDTETAAPRGLIDSESILDAVAEIHILFDREWHYLYLNRAAARAVNLPSEEILGRTLWEVSPDIIGSELDRQYHRAMDERLYVTLDYYYSGTDSWWEHRIYPSPEGVSVFARDITQRKKTEEALRESEQRFRSYFELGLAGTAISAPDQHFLAVNDKFCEIFGYQRRELLQMTWMEVIDPDHLPATITGFFERVLDGESDGFVHEHRGVRKDGRAFWAAISVKCLRHADGSLDYCMAQLQDITERRQAEEKISAYQEQLRSMASQISFVEERERRKIASALHDQVGQSLAMACVKLGALRQQVMPEALRGQVDEIREMVSQAIRDSRTLTFELSPPVLYELGLEAAIGFLAERYQKEHGIQIEFSQDRQHKPLSGDMRVLLFQAVRELLVNAIKHARARNLRISCRREGTEIRIMVGDDGVGFARAQRGAGNDEGHGFGLFFLRERLKYLGGSIDIASAPERGTQVTLRAPLALEEKGDAA
jgi:PAS domain S-box-containing protein